MATRPLLTVRACGLCSFVLRRASRIARLISYMKLGAEYAPQLLIRPEIVGSFGDVVVVFTNCDPAAIERRQTRAAFQRRNLKRRLPFGKAAYRTSAG